MFSMLMFALSSVKCTINDYSTRSSLSANGKGDQNGISESVSPRQPNACLKRASAWTTAMSPASAICLVRSGQMRIRCSFNELKDEGK